MVLNVRIYSVIIEEEWFCRTVLIIGRSRVGLVFVFVFTISIKAINIVDRINVSGTADYL